MKNSEKFFLGCKAVAGMPVSQLSSETQMSRQWIYDQKEHVQDFIRSLDYVDPCVPSIKIDDRLLRRMVLSLSLDCRASLEGIQRTCSFVLGVHLSVGKISSWIDEACLCAREFDDGISLDGIRQGANDEIFQGNVPILTGIDLESTYVYLLEEAGDRSADTWELFLGECKEHGLELDVSVNDSGTGLTAGIPRAFPDIQFQPDVFHGLRPLGKELARLERKACSLIKKEAELDERSQGRKPRKRTREQLEEIRMKMNRAIEEYDVMAILYGWLRELFGFSGYGLEETTALVEWVLTETEEHFPDRSALHKEVGKLRNHLAESLSYLKRLEEGFHDAAERNGLPQAAFRIMYEERAMSETTAEYNSPEEELGAMLGKNYGRARREFNQVLERTKRASSLVENLNGRIRTYINLKRMIPEKYLVLLKVYFNTKKYRRSRIPERIGKSPLELLTGKECPEFLEILGY